jgi:ribosomal protein S18 acetylase RimI-like enzyme
MLEFARGLSDAALSAVSELERRVVAADGGRLKLEWSTLRNRSGREVEDFLWWAEDRLAGFLGLYVHAAPVVELAGMVDPDSRRRGIGTALLDAALPICAARGYRPILLIVPRSSTPGRELALRRGAKLEHSEHALVLDGAPQDGPSDPRIAVRPGTVADAAEISRLLIAGFGGPAQEIRLSDFPHWLVVECDGEPVGALRASHHGNTGAVHGFVIDPVWQGQGIGRDVLRRVCRHFREGGATQVGLEVAVENDRALGLYTSLGFRPVITEDYYALPTARSIRDAAAQ